MKEVMGGEGSGGVGEGGDGWRGEWRRDGVEMEWRGVGEGGKCGVLYFVYELCLLLQQQCLKLLCAWRDRVAREQDESTK